MTDLRFDEAPHVAEIGRWSAAARADPYWDTGYVQGALGSWISRSVHERRMESGAEHDWPAKYGKQNRDGALWAVFHREEPLFHRRLALLAAVYMWKTLTTEQAAAFVGYEQGVIRWSDLSVLWDAELIERAVVPKVTRTSSLPDLLRPSSERSFNALCDLLSFSEQTAMTAGQAFSLGQRHDRHNVLATELGLRVAEFCEVALALGESVADANLFLPDSLSEAESQRIGRGCGDLVIVRPDGFKIVIEITASLGKRSRFVEKVDQWMDVILATPSGRHPEFGVCFVAAEHPDNRAGSAWTPLTKAVRQALLDRPEARRRGVQHYLSVARWKHWFPAPRTLSTDFLSMRAVRPTGITRADADDWDEVHLLDPIDMEHVPGGHSQDLLLGGATALGAPHWQRMPGVYDWGWWWEEHCFTT